MRATLSVSGAAKITPRGAIIRMSTPELRMQLLLAEYHRIQAEISQHKNTQQSVLNFIFVVVGIQVAAVPQIRTLSQAYLIVLLLLPVPFALLSFYHSCVHDEDSQLGIVFGY
jgi:hypothetical protein